MKHLFTISLLFLCFVAATQNINKISVEIYQNGSMIDSQVFTSFTPSVTIDETVSLNTAGLSPGVYSFSIYVTNDSNIRSIHASGSFLQEELVTTANVSILEYFIDNDPGVGMGTSISITPGSEISTTQLINTSGLSDGFHTIYLRGKDETGKWGGYGSHTIYIEKSAGFNDIVQIESLEYFIDNDPGMGMGTPISVSLSSDISTIENINMAGLGGGFHTVFLRGKLENGSWGPYDSKVVYVEDGVGQGDVVVIDQLEYFIDLDPGQGLGIPISIASSSNVSMIENLNLSALSSGFHTVYLRGKLQGGSWGPMAATTIFVEPAANSSNVVNIEALEYFIDIDPGKGLATPISVTVGSDIVTSQLLATSALSPGFHTVYLRGKLQNGTWGPYTSQTIYVQPTQSTSNQIVALEYFFDSDPGEGNAVPITTTLPTNAINDLINIATDTLAPGTHTVSVRARDESGAWGHYLTTSFTIDPAAASVLVVDPNGGETLTVGEVYTITWTDVGIPGTDLIEIRWSSDGGANYSILADGTFSMYNGSYSWVVPNAVGTNNLIEIANTTQAVSDGSDGSFEIASAPAPSVTVLTPNGGETLTVGEVYTITWTDVNVPGTDLIEIRWSSDGGANYSILADGTFSMYNGSYSWAVPNAVGTNNLIEIANTTQAVSDGSDGSFEIASAPAPSVAVLTPNGGETLTVGEVYTITWTDVNVPGTDLIEIRWSSDGGANYSILADGTFSMYNGSYSWTVPNAVGTNNLIEIANTTQAVSDSSDGSFEIIGNFGAPTALAPTGLTSFSFTANWTDRLASTYFLDVATDPNFDNRVVGYSNRDVGNTTAHTITGLMFGQSYYYRIRADFGTQLSDNSNVVHVKTLIDPETIADSVALLQIHTALKGATWDSVVNWTSARFRDWDRIVFNASRIQSVDLSNVGAVGQMPNPFTGIGLGGLDAMEEMDLSNNGIDVLMDFSATAVSTLNVSGNRLEFDDLEPLMGIANLQYNNQASLQFDGFTGEPVKIFNLADPSLTVLSGGTANSYAWYRNDVPIISGADFNVSGPTLDILDIDYNNMGEFRAEITSSIVPGLTIDVGPQVLLATANIEVNVTDFQNNALAGNVSAYLLQVTTSGGYDTLVDGRLENVSSSLTFTDIVLGDYLLAIDPNDRNAYIAGYYGDAFLWEEADTLQLRSDSTVVVKITAVPPSLVNGPGNLDVLIEEDFGDSGGRIDARRRAARRKCGLRRKRSGGRVTQNEEFELIAYGETDDNGEFKFGFLPQGTYRFFVEYPGIPLDENAQVEFEVGEAGISDTDFKLQAFATPDGIEVSIEAVLGVILEYFKALEIYPNPSSKFLNVRYRHLKSNDVVAQLLDLAGHTLFEVNLTSGFDGKFSIDVSSLDTGVYLLRFYDRLAPLDNVVGFRVIIQH